MTEKEINVDLKILKPINLLPNCYFHPTRGDLIRITKHVNKELYYLEHLINAFSYFIFDKSLHEIEEELIKIDNQYYDIQEDEAE